MKTCLMEGKDLSLRIENELKQDIKGCIIRPSVAVIQVGDDERSNIYVKLKEEACNRVGIYFRHYKYEEDTPELTIINKIKELNNDDYVNGIMIQMPLPAKYNEKRLINTILNSKDIDGLTDINTGRLINGRKSLIPCTSEAIIELLKEYNVELQNKEVTLIGKGKLVGRQLIYLLLNEGATVTVCHSRSLDIKKHTLASDIVISAAGCKNLVTDDMIKTGTVVVDVGCTFEDGKIYGDVDFDKVSKKASFITPKVGGVGPVTVAMFLKNVLFCFNNKKNK